MPKESKAGVTHHRVPIKLFHGCPEIGEALMEWNEELLISRSLKLPEIEAAEGGLAGINDALDRLRAGTGPRKVHCCAGGQRQQH